MPESIEELYARWQRNPDTAQTISLCEALSGTSRFDLVEIVGSHASRKLDVRALLAAARMYTQTERLDEAQTVLVAAGRLAPRDWAVFRWLGEVLLRRGDAERAEKVLERAVEMGADRAAQDLLHQARTHVAMQLAAGPNAVARAIRTTLSAPAPAPPPMQAVMPSGRVVPVESDDDIDTQIRKNNDIRSALDVALGPLSGARPVPAAGAPPPLPPPLPAQTASVALPPPSVSGRAQATAPYASPVATGHDPLKAIVAAVPAAAPPPGLNPFLAPTDAAQKAASGKIPEARDVLEALQIAGVYEVDAAGRPQTFAWAAPDKGRRRIASTAVLITLAIALVGGGAGFYRYTTDKRAKQHVEAEQLLVQVDKDLQASDAKLLDPSEKTIAQAFDLESRSSHAALTWLHERATLGLLKGGADLAFEDGIQRAMAVGIEDRQIAFARVASFLFQGDTAGAAAMIAKWDPVAQSDPWFQLLAGAAFERAGDPRALERYEVAVKLDPSLVAAEVGRARASAVDGDPHRAFELAKDFRTKFPARPEAAALVALAWARDPVRGDAPPEVKEVTAKGDDLPASLRAVPHASRAILALETHNLDEAKSSLQKALGAAETPGMASWIGGIALSTGDEELARKAALRAVGFSALYPPARVLAARVALLGARLDEALKAAEDLPPTSPDVAIVTAAVAYEKLDGERMARAFDPIREADRKLPFVLPLARGQALLAGNISAVPAGDKALDMADDDAPWADVVAMDYALDSGDLELARKIANQWKTEARPMRAVRLARFHRYDGKLDEADRFSKAALEGGTVTLRALAERVFTLIALKKDSEALGLFKAHPNVGGPLAKWLRAYATASHGKIEEAKAMVGQEDPPSTAAPMPARMIAAAAYGAMKDSRHGTDYVRAIAQAGFANADVATAAEKVGAGKVSRRGR